ncbi:MAG: DUF4153 domain-containing protein [Kiritimatiellae bacterium]|nr:DUF4153 domain-containing protein [Kiritimatiellia bacterium]
MKIRQSFSYALHILRSGFVRFAPFNVLMAICASCLVWGNHVPLFKIETRRIPVTLAAGACWGALFALAARLAVERRACRRAPAVALPAVAGAAMALLGAWLWHRMCETGAEQSLWGMLYFGGAVSIASLALAQMFGKRNAWTVSERIFLSAVFAGLVSMAAFLGLCLCISAYAALIARVSDTVFVDAVVLIWCTVAPMLTAAMLPKDNEPSGHSKAVAVLFWFLVPFGMALLAILYAYMARIVFAWSMPSGTMNWYASCAVGGYLFFWLSLRGSRVRMFAFLARWGWIALLPVVATQIAGIAIRYNAYGLTAPRMAGMATLAIGIYALSLAAFDRTARSAFVVLSVAGLVLTVSPFNILDVPIMQQSARLRSALERAGCFADGGFSVPEKLDVTENDAKIIDGAWRYLTERNRLFLGCPATDAGEDAVRFRQGVWNGNKFARDIAEAAGKQLSGQRRPNLPEMLGIDLAKCAEKRRDHPDSRTTCQFFLGDESGAVDISGYAKLETVAPVFSHEDGRYFIALSQRDPTNRIDVTAHVNKLLGNSGAMADMADISGDGYRSCTLRAEDAVWEIAPDMAFAVTSLIIYRPEERRSGHFLYGYILRK